MGYYQFMPEKSFRAKLYWSTTDSAPGSFEAARELRIGTTTNDAITESEGWLHAGVDTFTKEAVNSWGTNKRKFKTQFWFGCYETDGEHDYEIRAAGSDENTRSWEYSNYRLDINNNGYLGLYSTSDEPGHDAFAARSMIWHLEGFPTEGLSRGMMVGPMQLISLHGKAVKRIKEDTRYFVNKSSHPYLNEDMGEEGWLLIEIMEMGVARP